MAKKKIIKQEKNWVFGEPNEGKKLSIEYNGKKYERYPIKTDLVSRDTEILYFVTDYVKRFIMGITQSSGNWYVIVSEKIVAISQGRSFLIEDIKTGFWANNLSKFVTRTPYGIGLGSPWTMQIAIEEIGLPRILLAALASVITKPFGMKGVFYQVVGPEIAAIDGPTEYSVYPSNVSAKLAPKEPHKVAKQMKQNLMDHLSKEMRKSFGGVVIIDANDLGRNVLGNATEKPNSFFEALMKDNPMGQGKEQTPIILLSENYSGK